MTDLFVLRDIRTLADALEAVGDSEAAARLRARLQAGVRGVVDDLTAIRARVEAVDAPGLQELREAILEDVERALHNLGTVFSEVDLGTDGES